MELTRLGRSTRYRLMHEGQFPVPMKLSARTVAWRQSEIVDWIDSLSRARRQPD
jgi:prophage regulatory protein